MLVQQVVEHSISQFSSPQEDALAEWEMFLHCGRGPECTDPRGKDVQYTHQKVAEM